MFFNLSWSFNLLVFFLLLVTLFYEFNINNNDNIIENNNNLYSLKKLINFDIPRKLVKLPIMVKPYNASLFQRVNYVKEQFEEIKEEISSFGGSKLPREGFQGKEEAER